MQTAHQLYGDPLQGARKHTGTRNREAVGSAGPAPTPQLPSSLAPFKLSGGDFCILQNLHLGENFKGQASLPPNKTYPKHSENRIIFFVGPPKQK